MIEIFLFTKNEVDFIDVFINHHLKIVDKLTIIDNGSSDGTWEIILDFAAKHSNIKAYRHIESFNQKAIILTRYMKLSTASLLIPLDTDEIIGYEDRSGNVILEADKLRQYLLQLAKFNIGKLKIKKIYNFIPDSDNQFSIDKHRKFIFLKSDFHSVDTGFHKGKTLHEKKIIHKTKLVYLHFHFRSLNSWLKSTEQKLRARLGNNWNNIDSLLKYKKARSHHVAREYRNYLQTGKWHNLKPIKHINHNIIQP
jgi:glycosyltransferase involved in cell wall biosynthesis